MIAYVAFNSAGGVTGLIGFVDGLLLVLGVAGPYCIDLNRLVLSRDILRKAVPFWERLTDALVLLLHIRQQLFLCLLRQVINLL